MAPLVLSRHAAHLPCVGEVGVEANGCGGVVLGAGIVFEVELGYGAEHVWLCEKRLGLYGLVEVLYRQHIVIEVQRVLAYTHHLLGVDLRLYRHE